MAKEKVKKDSSALGAKWSYIGLSVFLIALGVCAMIWADISAEVICIAIGVAVIIFGVIRIIIYFMRKLPGVGLSYDFSLGLIALIVGVVLLIHPQGVIDLLQVVIGVFLLVDSVLKLQTAIDSKRFGMTGWWVPLIFTIICLVLGVMMVLKTNVIMVLIGAALVADGLQNLCLVVYSGIAARQLRRMDKDGDGKPDIFDATDEQSDAAPAEPEAPSDAPITPDVPLDEPDDNTNGGNTL